MADRGGNCRDSACSGFYSGPKARAATSPVTVSLTFDDSNQLPDPFAAADTSETDASACGYNSARGLGDTRDPENECPGCVYAETLTNQPDKFYLRAPDEVDST